MAISSAAQGGMAVLGADSCFMAEPQHDDNVSLGLFFS